MKILQVTLGFPPYQTGGTVSLTYLLSKGLTKNMNTKVFVFSGGLPSNVPYMFREDNFENVRIRRIHSVPSGYFDKKIPNVNIQTYKNPYVERLFEGFLEEIQPDIVHFQHTIGLSESLIYLTLKRKLKPVVTIRDFWYLCPRAHLLKPNGEICYGPEYGLNCFYCQTKEIVNRQNTPLSKKICNALPFKIPLTAKRYIKDTIEKRKYSKTVREYNKILPFIIRYYYVTEALKSTSYIISPSHFLKSSYVEKTGMKISNITIIPHGIIPFNIKKNKVFTEKQIRFGFIGLPGRYKGSHLLVKVFKKISPEIAKLVIWGKGWQEISKQIKSSENIILKGEYSLENLRKVFSSFDILIIPSICYETFSFVAHEAFYAKIPVIASNIGVFNEIIKHGKNGFLFKVNDTDSLYNCIKKIIDHPKLINEFSMNIKRPKTANEYVDEIYHFYKNILKS